MTKKAENAGSEIVNGQNCRDCDVGVSMMAKVLKSRKGVK